MCWTANSAARLVRETQDCGRGSHPKSCRKVPIQVYSWTAVQQIFIPHLTGVHSIVPDLIRGLFGSVVEVERSLVCYKLDVDVDSCYFPPLQAERNPLIVLSVVHADQGDKLSTACHEFLRHLCPRR